MKMRKFLAAATIVATFAMPFVAQAQSRVSAFKPNTDMQCLYIRFDGGPIWYAIAKSDPMYDSIYAPLFAASSTGTIRVSYQLSGSACGFSRLKYVCIGDC
jgi:hypothetical protein